MTEEGENLKKLKGQEKEGEQEREEEGKEEGGKRKKVEQIQSTTYIHRSLFQQEGHYYHFKHHFKQS